MEKIAIVNRTNFKNYGSVLQCYALCEVIKKLGYHSEIIWEKGNFSTNFDFRFRKIVMSVFKLIRYPQLIKSTWSNVGDMNSRIISEKTISLFEKFVEQYIEQKLYFSRELKKIAKTSQYKLFVCGSDQIWCSTTLYPDPLMYLCFAPKSKRVAYAPSFGRDYIPKYNRKKIKKYVQDIPHVSVREKEGQQLIYELTGRKVPIVVDPTLLLPREHWEKIQGDAIEINQFVLCYFLDSPTEEMQTMIMEKALSTKKAVVGLGSRLPVVEQLVEVYYPEAGPSEFLEYVRKSESIYTDSYHGMLFSIIYEKQFWSIERNYQQYDQSSRQKTVLSMLELNDRYICNVEDITDEQIDYQFCNERLVNWIECSKKYLKDALEA